MMVLKTMQKCALIILVAVMLPGCRSKEPEPTIDPYANMVQVRDGLGGFIWVPLYDNVTVSRFAESDFSSDGNYVTYTGSDYEVMRGIDVSYYQGDIDWARVRAEGVEFAIIRCGYRGYSVGDIYEDPKFRENVEKAVGEGLLVGVYFFSQAINESEAEEEANFVLKMIRGLDISLPIAFDWEHIGAGSEARTDSINQLTDIALAFCRTIHSAGYEPMIYFYRSLGYYQYELDKLPGIPIWVGAAGDYPDFYYDHYIWQYSFTGTVDGIEGEVDLDLLFKKLPKETQDP